ncbi:MAG TPA: undecaprenyl-diphosphate phosphatase [Chlamydiales bacterium]|nr:undecaprenyl-diphosphate phosphatase [Chlamydiales bacterium]
MTLFQSIILGVVQGLTEFFPVSSSAHLYLVKRLLGIPDGEHLLFFDLLCHSGTILALILFLKKEITQSLRNLKTVSLFALALIPLVPVYFLLKPLRVAASDPAYVGYFLIFTSSLLFLASKNRKFASSSDPVKVKDVLCIGMMQTMALIPGISRSGSTIATARLLGWDWLSAARFSFLLAIPAILGGCALESIKLLKETPSSPLLISFGCYAAGFATSFLIGIMSVRFMFRIYEKGVVRPFAWYCLCIGLVSLWALHG